MPGSSGQHHGMKQVGPHVQQGQEGTVKLIPEEGKLVRVSLMWGLEILMMQRCSRVTMDRSKHHGCSL